MNMYLTALTLASLALPVACRSPSELAPVIDRLAFEYAGGTLFAKPEQLSLKEIHLDTGGLSGREIIIEGKVAEVSEHATYVVLTDDSARMLVVLTDLEGSGPLLSATKPTSMRVLGTVENGKKGLPYVKARAVSAVKEPAAPPASGKA